MRKLLLLFCLVFLAVAGLNAQVTTSSLKGRVFGSKSAVDAEKKSATNEELPGANVVATHTPSGTTYGTVTQADGRFIIPGMRIGGPYTVKVSFVGYKEQTFN